MRIAFRTLSGLTLLLAAFAAQGAGKDPGFPMRPVRFVSPFAAGGNTDMVGRAIAPRLAERIGQNVIVENRPGAGGIIGTASVAKGTPDGHSLLFASGAFTSVAATAKNLPYDPLQDFSWINIVITYPFAVIVKNDSPVRSTRDLIELAKRNPGKLNYASVGVGSVFHLATELFGAMSATEMNHVPYKGSAEPLNELIGGRIDVIFTTLTGAYGQIKSGRVRAIAVASKERSPQLPDVPAVAETLPGYEVTSFAGIAAPRATPASVVALLNREVQEVLKQPDINRGFGELGGTVQFTTPEQAN
ncbi:MAG: tripartite tricarboxylate transporter substrate binding protein, partial [Burkholderiales bacterium]